MSYDINLIDVMGNVATVQRHDEGGTYVLGGTTEASLNVTYNYSWYYCKFLHPNGIGWLGDKTVQETAGQLLKAYFLILTPGVKEVYNAAMAQVGQPTLNGWPTQDYWTPTPQNAAAPLKTLLTWALEYPFGRWEVVL